MVQEIACTHLAEFTEVAGPIRNHLGGCVAGFEVVERRLRAQQFDDLLELESLRMRPMWDVRKFESHEHRLQRVAVGDLTLRRLSSGRYVAAEAVD
jgi:hypothetical protein